MKNFSSLIRSFGFILLYLAANSQVFGAETIKFESEIKGQLTQPFDLALDSSGQLFVFDAGKTIFVFDGQGKQQMSFATNTDASVEGQALNATSMSISSSNRIAIADSANSRIKVFNLSGELLFSFGTPGNLPGQFKSLAAVKVDAAGFIYVADHDNKRIQKFTPSGIFMKAIALSGVVADVALDTAGNIYALLQDLGKIEKFSGDGKKTGEILCKVNGRDQIQKSSRLQLDAWGNIYLTQTKEERIVKIDQSGNVLIGFGSEGNGRGQFLGIAALGIDSTGRVYVADSGNARVQIFKLTAPLKSPLAQAPASQFFLDFDSILDVEDSVTDIFTLPGKGLFGVSDKNNNIAIWNGPTFTIGHEGAGAGELSKPSAIFVTLDSRIYVADTANNRVQIFNYDGTLNYEFGKNGDKPGQFNSPQGIAVNGKGMIFVADTLNNRIEVFNQDGIFLNVISQESAVGENIPDNCQMLNHPKVLAIDSKDDLYVVDADATYVKVFDENGNCLKSIGEKGSGQFTKIVDVAVDQSDNIYVADSSDSRVHIFDPKGKFLMSFGCVGEGRGYFKQISSVAASEGRIFVADYLSHQIQVFKYSPDGLIGKPQRINTTRTAPPPPNSDNNQVLRYTIARKTAYSEATKEFTDSLGFSKEYLSLFVRVDSIESLNDGNIKVTISIPKYIPREIKSIESSVPKSGG